MKTSTTTTVVLAATLGVAAVGAWAKGGFGSISTSTAGSHSVSGYTKTDGTYVEPYHATNPNATKVDNYSSKPNVNPYTGKVGTVDPFAVPAPKQ